MLSRVERFIRDNNMLTATDCVLVGVSGGADSVCLLDILVQLSGRIGYSVRALHLNHMIRGAEADRDEQYVVELCHRLNVELACIHTDVVRMARDRGITLEEAGRIARYDAFGEVSGVTKIAVAHHEDDQAETVLHNILRGSSIKGAGGIRPVRDNIIRPLLCVTRKEIEAYLNEKKIEYCTDSTNLGEDYTRNKLRNVVIPYLAENINADAVDNINGCAADLRMAYDYLDSVAKKCYDRCLMGGNALNIEVICEEAPIIQKMVITRLLGECAGTVKDITRKHIDAVCNIMNGTVGRRANLPYGITVVKEYDRLQVVDESYVSRQVDYPYAECSENDFVCTVEDFDGDWKNITNDYTKVFDYDKIMGTVIMRKRQPGDYIVIDDKGSTKSIKSYFIDRKIPADIRDRIWLATVGSQVLWVVGYRTSMDCNTDADTNRIIKITIRRN